MIYQTGAEFRAARQKRVMVFGMSGLGKTTLSNMLRGAGGWFHYSVDYRIGTRYMNEYIADNFKREAMKVPLLRELLMSDSVYIASNITFDNLAPLSTYLGKPGDPAKGGVAFGEYQRRQGQHAAGHGFPAALQFVDAVRRWVLIAEGRRGEEALMRVGLRSHYAGQRQQAPCPGRGDELVAPVQPQPRERAGRSAFQPVLARADLDGYDALGGIFVTERADQLAVFAPRGADSVDGGE